jgi:hypothetical protein
MPSSARCPVWKHQKVAVFLSPPIDGWSKGSSEIVLSTIDKLEQKENNCPSESRERTMDPDRRTAWLRKLDEECPYQVVLPRRQLADDSAIMNFLMNYVGKFDMYVEDEYAAFVRYCFADPLDAAIFRSRFEPKVERLKLAGWSRSDIDDNGDAGALRQRCTGETRQSRGEPGTFSWPVVPPWLLQLRNNTITSIGTMPATIETAL